jgi:hypothetical protein
MARLGDVIVTRKNRHAWRDRLDLGQDIEAAYGGEAKVEKGQIHMAGSHQLERGGPSCAKRTS